MAINRYNGENSNSSSRWYDLFSRGARDWLRHNDKIRDAVKAHLTDMIAESGVLSGSDNRSLQVPIRFLEHYRFQLKKGDSRRVGQGEGKPGDVLREAGSGRNASREGSGEGEGGVEFIIELKVDEIIDWLWEELELPNLKPRESLIEEDDYIRTGWDRRGARARLDRRRTLKEAIKRRAVQKHPLPFTDDDLRYRQLVKRPLPSTRAVLFFALDVSSSMTEKDRKLAKTFFFWVLQGLKRQYRHLETVFVAHTVNAWEFDEQDFFQVSAQGGTLASKAFNKVLEIADDRFKPERYNIYLFYASDGGNFQEDREASLDALRSLMEFASFTGYVEVGQSKSDSLDTETARLFMQLSESDLPTASYALLEDGDIWDGIRAFFKHQADPANE